MELNGVICSYLGLIGNNVSIGQFTGTKLVKLDSQSRLAIPTKYRDVLQSESNNTLVATRGVNAAAPFLVLYPLLPWQQLVQQISKLPQNKPLTQALRRQVVGNADEIDLDGSGRILIPQPLREYAELHHDISLVGTGDVFEIWSKKHHEQWDKQPIDVEELYENDDYKNLPLS